MTENISPSPCPLPSREREKRNSPPPLPCAVISYTTQGRFLPSRGRKITSFES